MTVIKATIAFVGTGLGVIAVAIMISKEKLIGNYN